MTAPFSPELVSPANKKSSTTTVSTTIKFRSVVAGDHMATYALRRREMTPTIGSYEYWNGSTWVSSETFNNGPAAPNEIKNGMSFTVSTTGWTTDKVYQWSFKCRNGAAEASAYSVDSLVQIHAVPTMTISVSSLAVSRPKLYWVWAGAAGYFQKTYSLAVYTAAVQSQGGFDASLEFYQNQSTWMSEEMFSSEAWSEQVKADLSSGTTYHIYYKTSDSGDLSSGWVSAGSFTPSYSAIPAPTILLSPNVDGGFIEVTVRSSFNLLTDDLSIFDSGIGTWVGSLNCESSWDSVNKKLVLTGGGMSYSALDLAQGTYANQTANYGTYNDQKNAQAAPAGTARGVSGDQTGERIAVTNGVAYSAVATVKNSSVTTRTGKLGLRWYKSDHSASTTPVSQGAGTTLNVGVDTIVKVENVTAPADAAWAVIEFEWTTSAVGDIMSIDNVAFASTSSISWSPSGNSFDISFIIESSDDQVNWKPVWKCSSDNPLSSDSSSAIQVVVQDRSCPLGVPTVYYRAYAISKFSTNPVWSSVASDSISGINPKGWWLRRAELDDNSLDVRIMVADIQTSISLSRETFFPENQSQGVVAHGNTPNETILNIGLTTLDKSSHDLLYAALLSDETLFIHSNLEGERGYYFRAVGSINKSQVRAQAINANTSVRHMFRVSFEAMMVKDPY